MIDFPITLRNSVTARKARNVSEPYTAQQPQSGTPYFQRRTTGVREEWDVSFVFNRWDAELFDAFLVDLRDDDGRFQIPLKDERGNSLCTCVFTQWPSAVNSVAWTYSARLAVIERVDILTHDGVPLTHDGDYLTYG
tara:strand:+ start:13 stop:423 length:411 start_codon:yes stop_codon:yes gene_type:complete